jgi:membrane protein implicated in regulation of membrane protease activity
MLFLGAILLAIFVVPEPWGLVLVAVAAVLEIGESFLWIRYSQRLRIQAGAETLHGARAQVVTACAPLGQVRVQGELWSARCDGGAEPGSTVRVVGRDGLTLLVEPE